MAENNVFDLCKDKDGSINLDNAELLVYYIKAGIIPKGVVYDVPSSLPYSLMGFSKYYGLDQKNADKLAKKIKKALEIRNSIYDSINKEEYKNPDGTYKEEYDFLNYIVSLPNIYNITPYFNPYFYENKNKTRDDLDYFQMIKTSRFANLNEINKINYSKVHPALLNQLDYISTFDFTKWDYDSFEFFKNYSLPTNRAMEMMCDNVDSNFTTCGIISKVKYTGKRRKYASLRGYNDAKIKDHMLTTYCTDRCSFDPYPAGWQLQKSSLDGMRCASAFGGFIDYFKIGKEKRPQITSDVDNTTKYANPEAAFAEFTKTELYDTFVKLHKYMGCIGAIATFHAVAPKSEDTFYSSKELFDLAYGNPLKLATIDNTIYKNLIDEAENCCQKYIFTEKYYINDKSKQQNAKKVPCSTIDSIKHKNMINNLAKKVNSKDYHIK